MAQKKIRMFRVLEALSEYSEPAKPGDIAASIGEEPFSVGHDLFYSARRGLCEKTDKKKSLWRITVKGRETLANPPADWVYEDAEKESEEDAEKDAKKDAKDKVKVPSQAVMFKDIGEHLGVGTRGDIKLDAVIYYLERTANLDDLDSVWNALTEMGVVSDVKKRWIKLYSQTLSGKKVSEELSKKLEIEPEEKVSTQAEGPPVAKRFSVVNGQIISDPESELTFSMALQKVASEAGASSGQASEVAETFAKMSQDTLNTILPLLTKEPLPQDNTMINVLQQRVEQLADDKHKVEMDSLRTEMKSGQRSPEQDQQIQAMIQQINELKEAMHSQELARIQEQNQTALAGLTEEINKLKEGIVAGAQGKQAESKIGLMSKALDKGAEQLTGLRSDIKEIAPTILGRGSSPKKRSSTEKSGFGAGLDKGIEKAKASSALEDELFFGKES